MRGRPISDYGVIGNLRSVALVSTDGSVDWCCLPHLAAPSVFAALLDPKMGGRYRVGLGGGAVATQRYVEDTNVLETRWHGPTGILIVTDFMPVADSLDAAEETPAAPELHRLLRCESGSVEVEIEWAPRLDYARGETRLTGAPGGFVATCGADTLHLQGAPRGARLEGDVVRGRLRLVAGEAAALLVAWGEPAPEPTLERAEVALAETVRAWRAWVHKGEIVARSSWAGELAPLIRRSELVLKLLTYAETGAIAAAATTSLPETLGGVRNWDYRYAWIRDAGLTAQALTAVGHRREAMRFVLWAEAAAWACREREGRSLQIMYGLHGENDLPEELLPHLAGYQGSAPVRIGNEAAQQRQHDIYGELLTAAYELARTGEQLSAPLCRFLAWAADEAARRWHEVDSGIWEVRRTERHYTHSKVMSWAALDRAIRMAAAGHLTTGDTALWRRERERVHAAILAHGYNDDVGAFVQAFDSEALDASSLLIPMQELLPFDDPRVKSTIDRTLEQLTDNGLVYRYVIDDGLPGKEGAFGLTTFWLVDALALSGRRDEAHALFEGMVRRASPLGLYSEQIDPASGAFLGNFPQAFTHIGLINSALYLAYCEGKPTPVTPLLGTPEHRASHSQRGSP
jgi:GH15 family glucan-1,4-alpha-glucosidase